MKTQNMTSSDADLDSPQNKCCELCTEKNSLAWTCVAANTDSTQTQHAKLRVRHSQPSVTRDRDTFSNINACKCRDSCLSYVEAAGECRCMWGKEVEPQFCCCSSVWPRNDMIQSHTPNRRTLVSTTHHRQLRLQPRAFSHTLTQMSSNLSFCLPPLWQFSQQTRVNRPVCWHTHSKVILEGRRVFTHAVWLQSALQTDRPMHANTPPGSCFYPRISNMKHAAAPCHSSWRRTWNSRLVCPFTAF